MGRPTIADVAAESGLSVSTVNRVLNGKQNVREETVHKVFRAAETIGYHAAPLIKYRLQEDLPEVRLGVLLQKEDQRFYQNFAAAIENAVSSLSHVRARVEIIYAGSQDPDEQAELLLKLGARAQALAATAVDHHGITAAVQRLKARDIPVYALLNDSAQGVRHNYVGSITSKSAASQPGLSPKRRGVRAKWRFLSADCAGTGTNCGKPDSALIFANTPPNFPSWKHW